MRGPLRRRKDKIVEHNPVASSPEAVPQSSSLTLEQALSAKVQEFLVTTRCSQRHLARQLGVTQSAVSMILGERRRRNVLSFYERLAAILGRSLSGLIADLEARVLMSQAPLLQALQETREQLAPDHRTPSVFLSFAGSSAKGMHLPPPEGFDAAPQPATTRSPDEIAAVLFSLYRLLDTTTELGWCRECGTAAPRSATARTAPALDPAGAATAGRRRAGPADRDRVRAAKA